MRRFINSSAPEMPASKLLKSWARPPVSWPTASIFCDWRSFSSACMSMAVRSATRCSSVSLRARSLASASRRTSSAMVRSRREKGTDLLLVKINLSPFSLSLKARLVRSYRPATHRALPLDKPYRLFR